MRDATTRVTDPMVSSVGAGGERSGGDELETAGDTTRISNCSDKANRGPGNLTAYLRVTLPTH